MGIKVCLPRSCSTMRPNSSLDARVAASLRQDNGDGTYSKVPEKLHPSADGKWYRRGQPGLVVRHHPLGVLCPNNLLVFLVTGLTWGHLSAGGDRAGWRRRLPPSPGMYRLRRMLSARCLPDVYSFESG